MTENEQPKEAPPSDAPQVNVQKAHTQKAKGTSEQTKLPCRRALIITSAALIFPVALFVAWHKGGQSFVSDDVDTRALLTLLALVVALAAYLANVTREIVKKLNTSSDGDDEKFKQRCNIAWITAAEMQLVVLGLFVVVRIIFGKEPFIPTPFITEPILLDNIIWIYLGLTLLLLAFLHFRVWRSVSPFDIEKGS